METSSALLKKSQQKILLFLNVIALLNLIAFSTLYLLLPLYTTDPVSRGGLGMDVASAFGNYGTCFALSFVTPLIGGIIADLGFRKKATLVLGYVLSLCGLFSLTFYRGDFLWFSFWILVLGAGFVRAVVTPLVGHFSVLLGRNEQETYKIYYLYLCCGFILAGFLGGGMYAYFSFQAALYILCVLLSVSSVLAFSVMFQYHESVTTEVKEVKQEGVSLGKSFFFVVILASIPYYCCYAQMNTSMIYYLHNYVDRNVGSFEIPALWIDTSAAVVVTLSAMRSAWLRKERKLFTEIRTIGCGMGLVSIAFICLSLTTLLSSLKPTAFLWFFVSYGLIGLADLITRPKLYSAATTYVPVRWRGFTAGIVYLIIGGSIKLGAFFAGKAGGIGFPLYFGLFFMSTFLYFLVIVWLERRFIRKELYPVHLKN